MRRIGIGILAILMTALTAAGQATEAATAPSLPAQLHQTQPAVVIALHGQIDDLSRTHLTRHIEDARRLGAKTIILDINTYGGLVTAGLDISRFLKNQSDLHIIAYVDDKAISAGAMIALACDEIVMAPDATLGDCAPIAVTSEGSLEAMPAAERAKMESPILADFYDSATKHGYDPLLTSAMVDVTRTVHWVEKDDERKFVDDAEYAKLKVDGWTSVPDVPDPLDRADTLLTLHTDLATKTGLAKSSETSAAALASSRNLNVISTMSPAAGEKFVDWLGSAAVRAILMVIFLQTIYVAFHAPGHGAAEAAAVISLALLLGVPLLTGYAQWYEIVLIVLGLALLAFEFFVFPGHFVSAIVGGLMMVVGLVLTFVPKEPSGLPGLLPTLNQTWAALETGLISVISAGIISMIGWVLLSRYLPAIPFFNRLILTSVTGGTGAPVSSPSVSLRPAVGDIGTAITPLRPGGSAQFSIATGPTPDIILPVLSETGFLEAGVRIVVQDTSNNRILVRPA
jgi:membrane-bound serine protease (ClpP class)